MYLENKLDGISQQCKETYLALREFTETKQYFSISTFKAMSYTFFLCLNVYLCDDLYESSFFNFQMMSYMVFP